MNEGASTIKDLIGTLDFDMLEKGPLLLEEAPQLPVTTAMSTKGAAGALHICLSLNSKMS